MPLKPGTKQPAASDYLNRTFDPEDFADDANIGVVLGKGPTWLIDLDLDTQEAVQAAGLLAPLTRTSGRASKPRSHYWFRVEGMTKAHVYHDIPAPGTNGAGKVLLEVRAKGQTMIPPSMHPSGETVEWEASSAPILEMTEADVVAAAVKIAVVTLLARHWPDTGRHYVAGPVGGFLARLGYAPADIGRMVGAICDIAKDDEKADRVRFARESAEKQQRGEAVTGGHRLSEILPHGEAVLRLIHGWFGKTGDDEVERLNATYFVTQVGKDTVVGEELEDGDVRFLAFADFEKKYFNQYLDKKKLGRVWLEHRSRRTYDRTVFAPPGSREKVGTKSYNLWRGFVAAPMDGDPLPHLPRYLAHVQEVVASGDVEVADYVLDLLADCVQRPGAPVGKALALRSPQGFGKSMFVEAFGSLFGPHFIAVNSRRQLVERFNGHLSGKVVVFADEAIWGGNRQDLG
ncbi:MAG TPA: bifunctional DNA primase/polymerase, partial [Candidatus Dormibacteraeota bacterium]|nr:bifunctional DNA primase/polymerase [Candidatus Dormibacteraeota bacterium]